MTFLQRVFPKQPGMRRLPLGIAAGVVMKIDFSRHKRLYLGLYEVELNGWLRRFCQRGYNSFDVGGQSGYDALILAKLTRGRVISFEVDPVSCREMSETFKANPELGALLEVRQAFVAARSDPSRQRLALDDVAYSPEGFLPDVIKIDIEGAEAEALKGASRILKDRKPSLIVETHSPETDHECKTILEGFGYRPQTVPQRRLLPDFRPVPFNRWLVAEGLS